MVSFNNSGFFKVNIVVENRDRLGQVWSLVRDHLRWVLTHFPQNQQLMERAVVAIIRITNRNLFRLRQQQQQQYSPILSATKVSSCKSTGETANCSHVGRSTTATSAAPNSVVIVVEEEQGQQESETQKSSFLEIFLNIYFFNIYMNDQPIESALITLAFG